MGTRLQWMTRLELFEWVGLLASCAAIWVFVSYAPALDARMGQPGYHWDILRVVAGIYGRFIPWAIVVGAAIVSIAAYWLRMRRAEAFQRFGFGLRVFLAYCILLIVFRVVNFYVPVIHPGIRDATLQRIDRTLLFGREAADWLAPLASKWLTAVATGAYVSWFWLLFATIAILVIVNRDAATEYVFASLVAFYLGYVGYVLVPVIGPGYTLHEPVLGDIAPVFTTHRLLIPRDCFPSLHTAISVMMVIYIWRYQRRWSWFYIPMALLIIFATLYLRFHYFTDDLAGASMAFVVAQFAPVCCRAWRRLQSRVRDGVRLDMATGN
ncbi:MAG: phosphatase PAP2 family protein [Alicyclobacillus sp.]|nr:phosphatase PAP2 family protein [Alicyclobacillus sp.]